MTTKQAAFLAAVSTAIQIVASPIPIISGLVMQGEWNTRALPNVLFVLFFAAIFLSPLLVFFVCAYLGKPPLAIPERLRRPAWVAAVATGLSAAYVAFSAIREFIGSFDVTGVALMRTEHPFRWFWRWPLSGLIEILAAIGLPLFFFAVARGAAEPQSVSPRLKKAAMYAGIVSIVVAVCTTWGLTYTQVFYSTHQASLAAGRSAASAMLWHTILHVSLSLFYNGSLAWFFFLFYKTAPAAQSSQRLSSGE
jgi:hypothetical protein